LSPSFSRRAVVLYLAGLAAAAAAVFFLAFFLGRRPSLDQQLSRLTDPPPPKGATSGIPSLRPQEPVPEEAPAAPVPEGQPLGEGARVVRSPRPQTGLAVAVDVAALARFEFPGASGPRTHRDGLNRFFREAPPGLTVGLRSLEGAAGGCAGTNLLKSPGTWPADDLRIALDAPLERGPLNPLKAVEEAGASLSAVPGERAVVLLAGGADGCGADLCAGELPPAVAGARIHVILLAPPPAGTEAAADAAAPPVFDPPWAAPYRCLAERGGGTFSVATTPEALAEQLLRIARGLESVVVVRAFHGAGREVQGPSPEGAAGWGVTLDDHGGGEGGGQVRAVRTLPASFPVPGGTYVLRGRYGGQEKTVAVAVAPQERAEVRLEFATGELFVEVRDEAEEELVGDTAGFGCIWGAEVRAAGEEAPLGSTCRFPAHFELSPGSYRVRVWSKGTERVLEDVSVDAADTVVRSVVLARE
jgi:hypothetical protein